MRISKNSFRKNFASYVFYWKMRFLKSILLFFIEKWEFLRSLFRKILLMYYIEKWSFWSKILCFVLKNEEWGFLNTLFWKRFHPLCIILKNVVFEVNSFVLYWKMRIYKKLLYGKDSILYVLYWKMMYFKSILLFWFWKMRIYKNSFLNKISFLCIILKNDVFEVNSFVLY